MILASTKDFRLAAQRRLPRFLFEYIDGGAYDERTMRRNVSDLTEIALRQRVLRDVSQVDLSTTLFGRKLSMPVALGPVGISGMCCAPRRIAGSTGRLQSRHTVHAVDGIDLLHRGSREGLSRRRSGFSCM